MVLEAIVTQEVLNKYVQILRFPMNHPEMIPSLIPLVMGLIIVSFYYGRYRYEELGWGAAVSNSLLLVSTGIALLYQISPEVRVLDYFRTQGLAMVETGLTQNIAASVVDPRFAVAISIVGLGSILVFLCFYHLMPKRLAFNVSSGFMVYTLTYIAITIIYEQMQLVQSTYTAAVIFLVSTFLFVRMLKMFGKTFKK